MPPDLFARASWENKSLAESTRLWEQYVATSAIGAACPKVGIGFFHYPSLSMPIRGARAIAPISKGEYVCSVPVNELLSEYTVGNSSLHAVLQWVSSAPADKNSGAMGTPGVVRPRLRRRTLLDGRSGIALYMMRELVRERAPKMPYLRLVESHDTSGVPQLWPEDSPQFRALSPGLREMATRARASAHDKYDILVPPAIEHFPSLLSEGLGCAGGTCSREVLQSVYSWTRFHRLFVIVSARDWVLPVDGQDQAFMAPQADLLNFGQVGVRAEYSSVRRAFVLTATQPIAAGTEILFYYGTMCRDAWVNLYGFAPSEAKPCRTRPPPARSPPARSPPLPSRALQRQERHRVG